MNNVSSRLSPQWRPLYMYIYIYLFKYIYLFLLILHWNFVLFMSDHTLKLNFKDTLFWYPQKFLILRKISARFHFLRRLI